MSNREDFLENVRRSLGRSEKSPAPPINETALFDSVETVKARAVAAEERSAGEAVGLMSTLRETAERVGWKVRRVASHEEAAEHVMGLIRALEPRSVLRSAHTVVDGLGLEATLAEAGIGIEVMAIDQAGAEEQLRDRRASMRDKASRADVAVTGVDYAIAETGTCVIVARPGVSRLVSLLPPVHVALVERDQVLPGLDELFTLRRRDFLEGRPLGYMNLISGPSRSGDIDQTLVVGVHGPGEVHMVLIG
jgi:L-lactate utilization protein LutC